jgi:hypothetical protein
MKPNKKNIRKWVAALRSGKFKQGQGALKKTDDTYCCLGVACEISGTINGWEEDSFSSTLFPQGFRVMLLPPPVSEWLGIDEADPVLLKKKTENTAANLNDYGASFKRIATYIERKYLKD